MINGAHRAGLALGAGLAAAGLTLAATLPAQGATTPAWRTVSRLHYGATKVTGLAGGITTASALSPASMWAIAAGSAPQDTIAHYNGTGWQKVTSPALSGLQFNGILARSASDIWLSAMNGTKPILVHFNGHQWQRAAVPFTLSIGSLAADGQGGLWIAGDQVSNNHSYALHRTAAGAWSRTLLSTQALVGGFALVPGTTSAWAAGATPQGTGSDATIWAHGPAA